MKYIKYTIQQEIVGEKYNFFTVMLTEEDLKETVWNHMFSIIMDNIRDYIYEQCVSDVIQISKQEDTYEISVNDKIVAKYTIISIE